LGEKNTALENFSKKKKQSKEWEWNLSGKKFTDGEIKKVTLKIILDYKKIVIKK
jgi:hypothetical protein